MRTSTHLTTRVRVCKHYPERVATEPRTSKQRGSHSPSRAAWGSISRARVIDAAATLVDTRGFEQLTIRGLAAELGVAPMSLYRHVRDKDDVLDEVVDRLLATAWRPKASNANWRAWITEAADKLRRFLVDQPAALHIYLSHPVVSPAAIARMDAMMAMLRRAVGDEREAQRAYAALQTYTIGFAALEASRSGWQAPEGSAEPLAQQIAAFTTPQQFAAGLDYLLQGIRPSDG
jgi:TetR/AcrR family transcriptional regulator, tetracycline repressor protein